MPAIERLTPPVADRDVRDLATLLLDALASGAAVSFMASVTREQAEAWWRRTIDGARPSAVFLVARDADGVVGTVQLQPAWAPNQPHRAEVVKLIVHRRVRRQGLATALMRAAEDAAGVAGFRLLTLDTKRGDPAERLYRRLGWTEVGVIPRCAVTETADQPPVPATSRWQARSPARGQRTSYRLCRPGRLGDRRSAGAAHRPSRDPGIPSDQRCDPGAPGARPASWGRTR